MAPASQSDFASLQQALLSRLGSFSRWLRLRLAVRGAMRLAALAMALAALTLLADWQLDLSRAARQTVLAAAGVILVVAAWVLLIRDQLRQWGPLELAAAYDRAADVDVRTAVAPRVATALQLALEEAPQHSSDMAREAVRRSFQAIQQVDFREPLSKHRHASRWAALLACCLAPLAFAWLAPTPASIWRQRWLQGLDTPWPRATEIVVEGLVDGELLVPLGEPATLAVIARRADDPVDRVRIELRRPDRRRARHWLAPESDGSTRFVHDLAPLEQPAKVRITAGDARLGPIAITPIARPRIAGLQLTHQHPWDDGPQVHDFDRDDSLPSLLPETTAELRLTTAAPVKQLDARQQETESPLHWQRVDALTWEAKWTHCEAVQLSLILEGDRGGLQSHARSVVIGLTRDRPPTMTLRHFGVRRRVTPEAVIPMNANARDDFWLQHSQLNWTAERSVQSDEAVGDEASNASNPEELQPPYEGEGPQNESTGEHSFYGRETDDSEKIRTLELEHRFALTPLKLAPGDLVRLQATARDACYTGAQQTRSASLVFRVVKSEDLFREILLRQQQLRARLRAAGDRAETIRDQMNLAELPQERPALIRQLRTVQRDVAAVQRGLDASVLEMELNQLGGPESLALIRTSVITPLRQLHDGPLGRQLAALESLEEPTRDEALQRQREIANEINRILKNMAQWDSFIDVVNQLESVIKLQEQLQGDSRKMLIEAIKSVFEEDP